MIARLLRSSLLVSAAAAAMMLLLSAGAASAATICVGTSAPLCAVQDFAASQAGMNAALAKAGNTGTNPGHDKIVIGASFSTAGTLGYTDATNESLEIVGQGSTLTTITPSVAGIQVFDLDFNNTGMASSISALSIGNFAGAETGAPRGLTIHSGLAHDMVVSAKSEVAGSGSYAVYVFNGTTLNNIAISLHNDYAYGVWVDSTIAIDRITVVGDGSEGQAGVRGSSGSASIKHSSFRNVKHALEADGGSFQLSDVLMNLSGLADATGIYAVNGNNPSNYHISAIGTNLTIVGSGTSQTAARADMSGTGSSDTIDLSNSIVSLSDPSSTYFRCNNLGPSTTVTFNVSYTIADPTSKTENNCTINATNMLDITANPPAFTDPVADNFGLLATSPAIDAGDPAFSPAGGSTDLAGAPRLVNATGTCAARIDLGAYEFQTAKPACPSNGGGGAPSAPAPAPRTLTLGKPTGSFKLSRKPQPFAIGNANSKPNVRLTTNFDGQVRLMLTQIRGGYVSRGDCVKRKPRGGKAKRCDLGVKAGQLLAVKSGDTFLTFGGKIGKKTLAPGTYRLTAFGGLIIPFATTRLTLKKSR